MDARNQLLTFASTILVYALSRKFELLRQTQVVSGMNCSLALHIKNRITILENFLGIVGKALKDVTK
jgi:hypothetical protein